LAKIKIIGPAYPYRGGIAAFNERLASEYIRLGHSVEIETFSLQYPGFLFPGKTQYSEGGRSPDINIKRTINSISPFNWIRVGKKVRAENNDIVIFKFWLPFMGPCLGTIARIVKKNKHSKVIAVLDNIIPHEKRPGDRLLTRFFVKSQSGFIAMSGAVMNELELFRSKSPRLYSPHPVYDNYGEIIDRSEAINKLGLDPEFRYMLFFGLIRDYKGLDLFIKAFSESRFRKRKLKILVAGEFYTDSEKIFKLIDEKGLGDEIIIRSEFIPDSEVASWFCASDLVVQPYKSATQSGITQIGYNFLKPMLVTNVGGLPEIITHNKGGYVVDPEPSAIADAIDDFYSNSREKEFIEGIKMDKKKFGWDKMIKSIEKIVDQI
jgi:glycosyltransferase involved in cell wall biosynthesis